MKRGTIHLYNIGILFLNREFEHDIYELIRAFYPEAKLHSWYTETEKETCDLSFTVTRIEDSFQIAYENQDRKGVIAAQIIKGTSKDALLSCDAAEQSGQEPISREDRKQNKDILKRALYELLVKLSGKTLPWGNLTGIRPAKLAMAMLEDGMKNTEIAQEFRENYAVSPQKTALAITIANRERELLKEIDYEHGYSLYIGIPFCPSICLYCSFSSSPLKLWEKKVDTYLDALIREIAAVAPMMKHRKLDTIYFGGGTPTTLSPDQLDRLLTAVGEHFGFEGLKEFTIEAGRPDSITREKLEVIRRYPVTRISVNPQTMNQVTLDIIGRRHTVEETKQAFALARELGYDNINMDLIVGLPGEDCSMVAHTMEELKKLDPDSVTVHSLAVKRAARLNIFKDQYQEMTFENNQEIMDMTQRYAQEMGMGPYYLYRQKNMKGNFENVGYAKVDKAGIYNILIMEEKQPIIALGAGGSSKLVFDGGHRIERVENVKDVTNYITRIDEMIERKRIAIEKWLR
jgi:oxygen-independent coproporphyrinogen-3 oxidase